MDSSVKPAELLNAWRDAVRAAELAERLATTAAQTADEADARALVAAELAELAQQAAAAASRAAERADAAAAEAAAQARALRHDTLPDARRTVDSANEIEVEARTALQDAQERARDLNP